MHFVPFLPTRDDPTPLVISDYDGDLDFYLTDFVAVLGDVFNAILEFVQNAPRLPVQQHPKDLSGIRQNAKREPKFPFFTDCLCAVRQ